ncbi:MAG: DUF3293 domain-containing protein [Actinomycetales bacterium]|nr:DUF3293 domain-containing protein [Actinomycetales bacterium]
MPVPPHLRPLISHYLGSRVAVEVAGQWLPVQSALPLTGSPLHVITGWNPGFLRPGRARNDAANATVHEALTAAGGEIWPALGGDPTGSHVEHSWAVAGVAESTVCEIGAAHDQCAIFRVQPGLLTVIGCAERWQVSRPDP